ncbi:MAG: hypothetical protein J6K89_03200 [Oscillospiraceae bacterium]|nr:hypothetical protein [Oscillospiraceae bacterium]
MSASRERKERANNPVAQPQKKEKKKVSEGLILAISVVLVLVAVFGTVLGIRYYQRNQTVMTIGDKELTVKEFNYFFNQTASNFGNYASYLGIDTSKTIDKQTVGSENVSMMSMLGMDVDCLEPYKQEDGSYDITWAGYFAELAKETAAQTWAVYQAAMDAGYVIPEEIQTAIDNEMLNVDFYGQIYGMDADDFIEAQYGDGCDKENYEQHVRVSYIAADYASNYEYDAAAIDAKYAETPADFDVVTYMLYTSRASDYKTTEENAEDASEEATEEETEDTAAADAEAEAKAKEAAEKMAENFDIADAAVQVNADQLRSTAETYTTEDAAAWMFEEAKAGDVKMFENADTHTYYVVKVLSNDVNYQTINALQIFIAKDEETEEEDHTGHDHAEGEGHEDEEAAPTAAEKLEAVKSGLAADASEENFRKLATDNSSNSSVDLEEAAYSYINSSISKDAMLWAMEERKAGDYEVFETSTGTYVLYFLSNSETYRNLSVNSNLVNAWVDQLTATAVANCKFDMDAAMNGAVSLTLNNNANTETY